MRGCITADFDIQIVATCGVVYRQLYLAHPLFKAGCPRTPGCHTHVKCSASLAKSGCVSLSLLCRQQTEKGGRGQDTTTIPIPVVFVVIS